MTNKNVIGVIGIFAVIGFVPPAPPASPAPPDSPVADAAQRGDIETVRELLRTGADVNAAQGDGMTALHWSAMSGDVAMMEVLLYAGANVEPTTRLGGYTPLHLAAKEGLDDAVRTLLEAGSNPHTSTATGVRAIHFAAEAGQPAAILTLLDHGADVDARDAHASRTPLMFATAANRLDVIQTLIKAGADVTAATEVVDYAERSKVDGLERRKRARMMAAAREPRQRAARATEQADTTKARVPDSTTAHAETEPPDSTAQGALPDSTAKTAPDSTATLPDSTAQNEPDSPTRDSTRTAGTARAQPDSSPPPLSYSDIVGKQGGMTALHYAARDGRVEAVHMLLEAGAELNGPTGGDQTSPLLIAIINGNYDLALTLLERGADPNLVSEDGAGPLFATLNIEWSLRTWYPQPTAFHQQETTYLELMEALLEAGADPNARVKTHIWYAAYNAGRMGVDFSGATPLWRAAYATDVPAMKLLAAYSADPNIPTTKPPQRRFPGVPNRTSSPEDSTENKDPSGLEPVPVGGPAVHPLHAASGVGYGTSRVGQQHRHAPDGWLPAVKYLIEELGVDVNVRDHDGYSALHNAAARGDNELIEYLVGQGADVTFVSRRGQTTVDMANGPQQRVQPFPETIALLEGYGAKNNNKCMSCD